MKPSLHTAASASRENGMNWAEKMKINADEALLDSAVRDRMTTRRPKALSWDPFDVWLTRIKQPRDSATGSAPTGASKRVGDRPA
jgi:hypothetical protein